jgi:hypothetical protein
MKGCACRAVLAAGFLSCCAIASAAETPLTGAEIARTLTEATIMGVKDGHKWSQTFRKTGVTFYVMGSNTEQGRWKVDGDRYCSRWLSNEHWTCYSVSKDQDRIIFQHHSGSHWIAKIVY